MSFKPCPLCGRNVLTQNILYGGIMAITYSCLDDGDYAVTPELNEFLVHKASKQEKLKFQCKVAQAVSECEFPDELPVFDSIHG